MNWNRTKSHRGTNACAPIEVARPHFLLKQMPLKLKVYAYITPTIGLKVAMTSIERGVESTRVKVTITKCAGIELDVMPCIGAFVNPDSIGRLFRMTCENKDLCAQSSAGLSNPKILEAMLKFAPMTVEYNHSVVTVRYASSFFGVDTSLSLIAIRMRKQKPCIELAK